MHDTAKEFQAAVRATTEASLALASAQFAATEKFAILNAKAGKATFEDSLACARSMYELAIRAGTDFSKVAERHVGEWNENLVSLLDKAAKNAPAGSDVAVSAVKQVIATANSAYVSINKAAEANLAAATETIKDLPKARKAA